MTKTRWVDYKQLREEVDFGQVLDHYQVEVKVKGEQAQGFCPLPNHEGKRRSPSFSAHLKKNIWQCFGCGAKGNVLDFACLMEGADPEDHEQFRKVALQVQTRFLGEDDESTAGQSSAKTDAKTKDASTKDTSDGAEARATASEGKDARRDGEKVIEAGAHKEADAGGRPAVVVNAPLDFELKRLDSDHPYLSERGLTPKTISHFGLGFCKRGIMASRIAIPLRDAQGQLIGYAGRLVADADISEDKPKYRFPGHREHEDVVHEFKKSRFLYHGHGIQAPVDDLIIVEGFPDVWWLWQCGHRNVVGVMGASCSDEQAQLIVDLTAENGHVWTLPDGDSGGERCAASVLTQVAPHRWVRWVKLENGQQPTDCSSDELASMLAGK